MENLEHQILRENQKEKVKMQNDRAKMTNPKHKIRNPEQCQNTNDQNPKQMSFGI
jgi:hypothetical protein